MAEVQTTPNGPSTTSLVADIISDAQQLIQQQLAMFRAEIKQDLSKARDSAPPLAFGAGLGVVAFVLLSLMVVHLLEWAFRPNLELWACYAIVGGVMSVGGLALFWTGKKGFDANNPLPDQTAQAMKENMQWLTNPK